jgi:hypothetical protein
MMTTSEAPTDNGVNVQALLDAAWHWWRGEREVHLACQQRVARGTLQNEITGFFGLGGEQSHRPGLRRRPPRCSRPRTLVRPRQYVVGLASCLTAGIAAVANRELKLNSVKATLEGDMDILGISG